MNALVTLFVVAVALLIFMAYSLGKRKKISPAASKRLLRQWESVLSVSDPAYRVLEADKVIDSLLNELGYSGSFSDKMKAAGPRIKNENAIWSAHKLRNRIAHESGVSVSQSEAKRAVAAFEKLLHSHCR